MVPTHRTGYCSILHQNRTSVFLFFYCAPYTLNQLQTALDLNSLLPLDWFRAFITDLFYLIVIAFNHNCNHNYSLLTYSYCNLFFISLFLFCILSIIVLFSFFLLLSHLTGLHLETNVQYLLSGSLEIK